MPAARTGSAALNPEGRPNGSRRPLRARPFVRWLRSARYEIRERSMLPLLQPGDRVLVDRGAYRRLSPERGDLVVLHDPEHPGRRLLKRVAGIPGDLLRRDDEGFAVGLQGIASGEGSTHRRLHPNELFVCGDNPSVSRDSRRFGPVDRARVIGRVWFRYAPADRVGTLE